MKFGPCTILVGKNNSGKSNILKAIDLVLGERFYKPTKHDYFDGDETQTIKFVLHFSDFTDPEIEDIVSKISYTCNVDGRCYRAADYRGLLYSTRLARIELEMSGRGVEQKLYLGDKYYKYLSAPLKNAIITSVHIPSVRDHTQILKTTDYSFLGKLLAKLYEGAQEEQKAILNQKLVESNQACNDIFLRSQNRLNEISQSIISHNGIKFSFIPSNPKESYRKLDILLDDGIESGLDFKGSGIQSVIIISLFKLYSEVKAGQALLLVEEPELFLHPHANRHMASVLREFCNTQGVQLIITTHSAQYLLDRDISEIALVSKIGKETVVKRPNVNLDEVKLKKELTESNLELFFSEKVLLVEGQSDKIAYQAFAKSIDRGFDFDAKNIGIIETGSSSNLNIYIDLLEAYEIPWLAVVDKDVIEDKWTLNGLNNHLNLGLNLDSDSPERKADILKTNGIHVLGNGEIENYYQKDWLYTILSDYLEETDLPTDRKSELQRIIENMVDPAVGGEIKHQLSTYDWLSPENLNILKKIVNSKIGLLQLRMDEPHIGRILERQIFSNMNLSKPKIALKIRKQIKINNFQDNRQAEIVHLLARIFAA